MSAWSTSVFLSQLLISECSRILFFASRAACCLAYPPCDVWFAGDGDSAVRKGKGIRLWKKPLLVTDFPAWYFSGTVIPKLWANFSKLDIVEILRLTHPDWSKRTRKDSLEFIGGFEASSGGSIFCCMYCLCHLNTFYSYATNGQLLFNCQFFFSGLQHLWFTTIHPWPMFIQDFLVHTNEYYGITPTQEVNLTAPVLVQAQVEGNHGILMPWWAFLQWVSWQPWHSTDFFQEKLFRDMLS